MKTGGNAKYVALPKNEEELIYALLEKKHFDITTADMKSRQKMYRHLLYKGFSAEGVGRVFHDSFQ